MRAKSATKQRTASTAAKKMKRPRKVNRASAQGDTCGYKQEWSLLASTRGYVAVWVSRKVYDQAARHFIKAAKEKDQKQMLRQRMAPLGLEVKCEGTCQGGWCREKMIFDGGSSKVFICECDYFV